MPQKHCLFPLFLFFLYPDWWTSATCFSQNCDFARIGGADPLVRGRRPRRPACTLHVADHVVQAAGRGRPGPEGTPTGGSAPPMPASQYQLAIASSSNSSAASQGALAYDRIFVFTMRSISR